MRQIANEQDNPSCKSPMAGRSTEEAMWEHEDEGRANHPELFEKIGL